MDMYTLTVFQYSTLLTIRARTTYAYFRTIEWRNACMTFKLICSVLLVNMAAGLVCFCGVQGNVALEKSKHKKPFPWIPELGWEDAVRLAEVSPDDFSSLLEDIDQNESKWKKVKLFLVTLFQNTSYA